MDMEYYGIQDLLKNKKNNPNSIPINQNWESQDAPIGWMSFSTLAILSH